MTLPHHLQQLANRVARHEMGHYVISRALGFRTGDVSIEIIGPVDGHLGMASITLPEAIGSIEDLRVYLERRIIVLYAGGVAETLPGPGSPIKKANTDEADEILKNPKPGMEQDHAKIRELLHVLRNVSCSSADLSDEDAIQAELDELNNRLYARTVELVNELAEPIIGLGCNLADRVEAQGTVATLEAAYLEGLSGVQRIVQVTP